MNNFIAWDPTKVFYVKDDGTILVTDLDSFSVETASIARLHSQISMIIHYTQLNHVRNLPNPPLKGIKNEKK